MSYKRSLTTSQQPGSAGRLFLSHKKVREKTGKLAKPPEATKRVRFVRDLSRKNEKHPIIENDFFFLFFSKIFTLL